MATRNTSWVVTSIFASSDIGKIRDNNEDNFIIADLNDGKHYTFPQSIRRSIDKNQLLIAVSDGMGGAQAGEMASAMAVYALKLELIRLIKAKIIDSEMDLLIKAIEKVNQLIWENSKTNLKLKGMGATITALLISGNHAYIAEVGDSRAYVIRQNKIRQLTTDQSLFEILTQSGSFPIGLEPADSTRNIILQSMGGQEKIHVAITSLELCFGDYLLLCSDGLSNKLAAEEMWEIISNAPNLERAGVKMMDIAKERGGEDNITVVLAKFEGNGLTKTISKSLTQSIEILTAYDPLTGGIERKIKRITEQMVSGRIKRDEDLIFRSTLGVMPQTEYPYRNKALLESNKSVESLQQASKQLSAVIIQMQLLEKWLASQGRLDSSLQKAVAHLEYAIKNTQKIEIVARKAHNLMERLSAKTDYSTDE